jgi:hypothetical protein
VPKQPPALPDDYATLAGHSDDTVSDRTGKTWPEWVRELDEAGAMDMSHAEIARRVNDQIGQGWWSQTVAVGYERIRGLREVGQTRDGGFAANKSRTIGAPLETVFDAFADDATRRRWLDVELDIRGATPGKSVRMDWPDGTDVVVWLTEKGPDRCTVSLQHGKLASADAKESSKEYWDERLGELKALLE